MKKMQKKSLLIAGISFLLINVMTLSTANAQFSIGIKGAVNAANYMNLTKKKIGWEAGVFMRMGDRFYFQPEVNYVFKCSSILDVVDEVSSNIQMKQHYIAVPALLGYHFINNENFKFHLTIGPRFDFKIADNMGESGWQTNTVQWGGQVGIGIDFWRFTLDVSYCIAADRFKYTTTSEPNTKMTNMFLASLGFKFIK
jgi:hypothetical protein